MELVSGLGSFIRNVIGTQTELKRTLQKMDVLLMRSQRLLQQANLDAVGDRKEIQLYNRILGRGKQTYIKVQNFLNGLSIAGRIKINLPFNRTRQQLTESMEELEGMISELKDLKSLDQGECVKRKLTDDRMKSSTSTMHDSKTDRLKRVEEIDQQHDNGTTAEDSRDIGKGTEIRIKLTFQADQPISKKMLAEIPSLAVIQKSFRFKDNENQNVIFSLSRMTFKGCYAKIKSFIPQIDCISKENHMKVICRRQKKSKTHKNTVRKSTCQTTNEQDSKQESKNNPQAKEEYEEYSYSFVCINESTKGKVYFQRNNNLWQKLPQQELILQVGDRITPILKRPECTYAAFSYAIDFTEHK